jgi:hypothetical protein
VLDISNNSQVDDDDDDLHATIPKVPQQASFNLTPQL